MLKNIPLILIIIGIFTSFFLREHYSYKYLQEFKHIPTTQEEGGVYHPIKIPFWVNLNLQDSLGYSFLHYAVNRADISVVRQLLLRGAFVNMQSMLGQAPLHLSAIYGQVDIIKILLGYGAKINLLDQYKKSPIMYAVERGAIATVKVLNKNQANLLLEDEQTLNILDKAILHEYRNIVLYLLQFVGAKNSQQEEETVDFLTDWKKKYNRQFGIIPVYNDGLMEYYSARFRILPFTKIEEMSIKFFLFKRFQRKNPDAIFQW